MSNFTHPTPTTGSTSLHPESDCYCFTAPRTAGAPYPAVSLDQAMYGRLLQLKHPPKSLKLFSEELLNHLQGASEQIGSACTISGLLFRQLERNDTKGSALSLVRAIAIFAGRAARDLESMREDFATAIHKELDKPQPIIAKSAKKARPFRIKREAGLSPESGNYCFCSPRTETAPYPAGTLEETVYELLHKAKEDPPELAAIDDVTLGYAFSIDEYTSSAEAVSGLLYRELERSTGVSNHYLDSARALGILLSEARYEVEMLQECLRLSILQAFGEEV